MKLLYLASAYSNNDPQSLPRQLFGGHIPREALEERCESLRMRLLLRSARARQRARERAAGDPHSSPLPHQRAQASHLLCGRHSERGASSLVIEFLHRVVDTFQVCAQSSQLPRTHPPSLTPMFLRSPSCSVTLNSHPDDKRSFPPVFIIFVPLSSGLFRSVY